MFEWVFYVIFIKLGVCFIFFGGLGVLGGGGGFFVVFCKVCFWGFCGWWLGDFM